MLCSDRKSVVREPAAAAFAAAAALGPGFVSGREITAFYAQTGGASWLGILMCSGFFGVFVALTAYFARKTGAIHFPQIFRRSLGVYAGGTVWVLHVLVLAVMSYYFVNAAGQAMGLLLPAQNARLIGMLAALAAAVMLVQSGAQTAGGLLMAMLLLAFVLCLALFGRLPAGSQVYLHTRLTLEDSAKGAAVLAALHGCRAAAFTASVVSASTRGMRPARLGICAGGWMLILLGTGNAALRKHPAQLLALSRPFAAMCAEWGKAGHCAAAMLMWLTAVVSLSGAVVSFRALLRRK